MPMKRGLDVGGVRDIEIEKEVASKPRESRNSSQQIEKRRIKRVVLRANHFV
jgi:hypothetical protein